MKVDFEKLLKGDRRNLAKAITLIESSRPEDTIEAQKILEKALPHTGKSFRLGITGVPGVGKSTFIESFGLQLISKGFKLAVLAIDPSSPVSGGSILGDKTRMEELSREENAFIRPSPSLGFLGGVAQKTRESILLCEAAGFDYIIIETVGVGQSEFEVADMVDFFLVLMLPNAGDEIQGMKKGILELAHSIIINKSDGESINAATQTQAQYQSALSLMRHDPLWATQVQTCSALEKRNLDGIYKMLQDYDSTFRSNGHLVSNRLKQNKNWFKKLFTELIEQKIKTDHSLLAAKNKFEQDVIAGKMLPIKAANEFIKTLLK